MQRTCAIRMTFRIEAACNTAERRDGPMLPKSELACFLIADISGYTSYLAGVELDHAQDIIADLMDTVVKCLRSPFRVVKFEGDAAFLCAVGDKFDGSMIHDATTRPQVCRSPRRIHQAKDGWT